MKRREFNKSQNCRIRVITGAPDYTPSGVVMRRENAIYLDDFGFRENRTYYVDFKKFSSAFEEKLNALGDGDTLYIERVSNFGDIFQHITLSDVCGTKVSPYEFAFTEKRKSTGHESAFQPMWTVQWLKRLQYGNKDIDEYQLKFMR